MGEGHNFLAKLFLSLVALPPVNNDRSLIYSHEISPRLSQDVRTKPITKLPIRNSIRSLNGGWQ